MHYCAQKESICDNIGILPFRLPDNKTFVYTTDTAEWLEFNPDDLTTSGWFEWNKSDFGGNIATGTTHIVNDVGTTDTIGLLDALDVGITGMHNFLHFFRISADDIHKKIKIGTMDMGSKMPYYHSFGHTEDYLCFPKNSVDFSSAGMFEGHPMIDNFDFNYDNPVVFYIMKKSDGTYKEYTADHGAFIIHSGNSYVDEENNYIYDTEMFVKSGNNPFIFFDLNWLRNTSRDVKSVNMRMRRYTINLDSGDVSYEDLLTKDSDGAGFIMINPNF